MIESREEFYAFFTPRDANKPEIHGGFALAYWNGSAQLEAQIKDELKVTIRCIPFENKPVAGRCIFTGEPSHSARSGRSLTSKPSNPRPMSFILVINCGSSSLKFSIIDPENGTPQIQGLAERLSTRRPLSSRSSSRGSTMKSSCPMPSTSMFWTRSSARWETSKSSESVTGLFMAERHLKRASKSTRMWSGELMNALNWLRCTIRPI